MEPFHAEKQALRQHVTYIQACQTGPVMYDMPAGAWVWKRDLHLVDSNKLVSAARKMDWLFRGALACNNEWGCLSPTHIAAIDDFLRFIRATRPSMGYIAPEVNPVIDQRLAFADLVLNLYRFEREQNGWDNNIGSQWFENMVIRYGFTMDEIIYRNPFKTLYAAPGCYSGVSTVESKILTMHRVIKEFWQ